MKVKANRATLIPLIGKVVRLTAKLKTYIGELALVCDTYCAIINDDSSHSSSSISSQLRLLNNPVYHVPDKTIVRWLQFDFMEMTVEEVAAEEVDVSSNDGDISSNDEAAQAAWGQANYVAPEGAPFEFL